MEPLILIASRSPQLLALCEQGLQGFAPIDPVTDIAALNERLLKAGPPVLLLDVDLPGLNGSFGVAELRRSNPATKIIAFTGLICDDLELALFKSGARGCAQIDIDPQLLKRIVVAVQQGELWIRRRITLRLLDELSENARTEVKHRRISDARLAILTQREREIAALIGTGESNKQIARKLSITERTVKAHLTEIFRKLGISDRLRLALRMTRSIQHDSHTPA